MDEGRQESGLGLGKTAGFSTTIDPVGLKPCLTKSINTAETNEIISRNNQMPPYSLPKNHAYNFDGKNKYHF